MSAMHNTNPEKEIPKWDNPIQEKTEDSGDGYIEPATSLWEASTKYHIIAQIPGISEEKIQIDLERNHVTIYASGLDKAYKKEIILPDEARLGDKTFENGVLRLILNKV